MIRVGITISSESFSITLVLPGAMVTNVIALQIVLDGPVVPETALGCEIDRGIIGPVWVYVGAELVSYNEGPVAGGLHPRYGSNLASVYGCQIVLGVMVRQRS